MYHSGRTRGPTGPAPEIVGEDQRWLGARARLPARGRRRELEGGRRRLRAGAARVRVRLLWEPGNNIILIA